MCWSWTAAICAPRAGRSDALLIQLLDLCHRLRVSLTAHSPFHWPATVMKGLGVKPGIPDIVVVSDGRFFGLELKMQGGRLSPDQRDAHSLLLTDFGRDLVPNLEKTLQHGTSLFAGPRNKVRPQPSSAGWYLLQPPSATQASR
jgi:hypothetical protein